MSGFTSIMRERPDLVILASRDAGRRRRLGRTADARHPRHCPDPIIIITASDEPTRERARSIGAAAFVPKPLDMELVLRAVEGSVNVSSGNPPA